MDHLHDTISTLPEKLSYPVMVPLGSDKAFYPGKIVNTNKILTPIGAEYYSWKSSKDAASTLDRQRKGEFCSLEHNLEDCLVQVASKLKLEKELKDITDRMDSLVKLKEEHREIREEYHSDDETLFNVAIDDQGVSTKYLILSLNVYRSGKIR